MNKYIQLTLTVCFLWCCIPPASLAAPKKYEIRAMANKGAFYTEKPKALQQELLTLYKNAGAPDVPGRLVASIVPHAAMQFAGPVTAEAFKHLQPGQFKRVIILGPSHYSDFDLCSIARVSGYQTPFGIVPLDGKAIEHLAKTRLFRQRKIRFNETKYQVPIHSREHSIEVILPYLHERLQNFALVPILVGRFIDGNGNYNASLADITADAIRPLLDKDTLLIVSTDFTHYGKEFEFTPFPDNMTRGITALDMEAFDHILKHDVKGFEEYMKYTKNQICGETALYLFIRLLSKNARGMLLKHTLSTAITHNPERSVSYASINFYNLSKAPAPKAPPPTIQIQPE